MIAWDEWNRYWHKRMPSLDWLSHYDPRRDFKFDFIAGFTVAVMLVPQEMSFAVLMGVPAQYGLYTAATAPLLYPLFGSSRALSVANTAEGSLLIGVLLQAVEIKSVEERVATGILMTFFAGLFMVCSGFLHHGGAVSFFSRTSMNGYVTATSFLIITSQLPPWLGVVLHKKAPLTVFTIAEIIGEIPRTNLCSFALGVFSFVFLLATKLLKAVLVSVEEDTRKLRLVTTSEVATECENNEGDVQDDGDDDVAKAGNSNGDNRSAAIAPMPSKVYDQLKTNCSPRVATTPPNPHSLHRFFATRPRLALACSVVCDGSAFIACVTGMVVGKVVGENALKLTGDVPKGLPMPVFPPSALGEAIPWDRLQGIVSNSVMVAIIFFMSSVAAGSKLANQAGYEISPNQELLGLGFANLGSAFFQGMPSTGGLSRSAVASQSARTPFASIVTAILVVVTLLFLTGPLYYLPQAPLAVIIMLSSYKLMDFTEPRWLKRVNRHDFYVWTASFCGTLVFGLLQGLMISVWASLGAIMVKSKKPPVITLGKLPDGAFGDIADPDRDAVATELQDVVIVRMAHAMFFANASHFIHAVERSLQAAKARGRVLGVVVDGSRMNSIDASSIHALLDYNHKLQARDQKLTFANLRQETATSLIESGLWKASGGDAGKLERQLMGDIDAAVVFLRGPSS